MVTARSWLAVGASVRGDAHRRAGTPNQDAFAVSPGNGVRPIVAVADGHGSKVSFRSDAGSRIAVGTALHELEAFVTANRDVGSLRDLERRVAKELPSSIVGSWTERVQHDLAEDPFETEELDRLATQGGAGLVHEAQRQPILAYGATLLAAAVVDPSYLLLIQIGDGDIVVVDDEGPSSTRRPVPADPRLVGNETTSLCLEGAADDFRVAVLDLDEPDAPRLVVLTTDGYANSFVDENAFLQAAPDIAGMIRQNGIDWVAGELPRWLQTASRQGSGDDISMAVLWRPDRDAAGDDAAGDDARPDARRTSRGRPSRGATLAVAVAALALGAVGGAAIASGGGEPSASPSSPPVLTPRPGVSRATDYVWMGGDVVQPIGPEGTIGSTFEIAEIRGGPVVDIVSAFGWIWISVDGGPLLAVDDDDHARVKRVSLAAPGALSPRNGGLLVASADGTGWSIVNAETFEVTYESVGSPVPSTVAPSPGDDGHPDDTATSPSAGKG